jgi:hypothetical protein
MDSSDKLRRDQSKSAWIYYSTVTLAAQPRCNTGCGGSLNSTCVLQFNSFEQRYLTAFGRANLAAETCTPSSFYQLDLPHND